MNYTEFARAVLHPDAALPSGLIDPAGKPALRRFGVYRNNVALGLIRVLEAGFPAVAQLVGSAFFTAMAGAFVRAHPPKTRIMMLYGDEFANFIAGFAPAAKLGYLADVARLEQMLRQSYHAADSSPMDPRQFAAMSEAQLLKLRLHFAPTALLLRSNWPVYSIWAANMRDGPAPKMQGEDVLILRPDYDPVPHLLPAHSAAVLHALMQAAPLGKALAMADAALDISTLLKLLLNGGAITGVEPCA